MTVLFKASILALLISPYCFAQDPMPVLGSSWERTIQKAPKPQPAQGPARGLTNDDKYFQRKAREARTDSPTDPNESTIDGRSAAMDRAVHEARTPKMDDVTGYRYVADVRNDSGKKVKVVYWEYRFVELARPTNITRRQFLCAVDLKAGNEIRLSAFSLLGPSDTIDAESLAKSNQKLFDERVQINRIEFADGTFRQRGNWKVEDVQAGVDRAASTPWGKEICRGL